MSESALHVGLGNSMRRDDGVGPWLAQRLEETGLRTLSWPADGSGLIDLFTTEQQVVLLDATRSGAQPGTLHRFDARHVPLPRPLFHNSTHEFGLAEAVELARRLGQLPERLTVLGIEGAEFGWGTGLSGPVRRTAEALVAELQRDAHRL